MMGRELLIGIAVTLAVDLFWDVTTWLSKWLTKLSARRLPESLRERYEEEWFEVISHTSRWLRLLRALDLLRASMAIRSSYKLNKQGARQSALDAKMNFNELAWRCIELISTSFVLVLISPVLLFVSIGIRFSSEGPIIVKQRRFGIDGRQIAIYKFRPMHVNEGHKGARITPLGKFLRRSSLDELPQLLNVLQGHCSLIGPRPMALPLPKHLQEIADKSLAGRHIKPGITGLAQINGFRGQIPEDHFRDQLEFDLQLFNKPSIWRKIKILVKTYIKALSLD